MKKLTAGIFAGILTIVSVNAADAAITSKAYVDGKIGAVETKVTQNTSNITELTEKVETLSGDGTGSVADQIAGVLEGIEVTKPADAQGVAKSVTQENGKIAVTYAQIANADVADNAAIAQSKIDGLTGALNAKLDVTTASSTYETIENVNAIEAKIPEAASATNQLVDKAAMTTALDAKANQNIIGSGFTAENTVAKAIEDAKSAAGSNVDEKLGGDFKEGATVQDALDAKQDKLNNENVKAGTGTGNVVSSVTAVNGIVTVDKAINAVTVPTSNTPSETGTYVLTATVSAEGEPTYYWESIERAATTGE